MGVNCSRLYSLQVIGTWITLRKRIKRFCLNCHIITRNQRGIINGKQKTLGELLKQAVVAAHVIIIITGTKNEEEGVEGRGGDEIRFARGK